jgi:hypothetical protein
MTNDAAGILMVGDKLEGVELTRHGSKRDRVSGSIPVTRDRAEPLDSHFRAGQITGAGDDANTPKAVLLDMKLPPVDLDQFTEAIRKIGHYLVSLNSPPLA